VWERVSASPGLAEVLVATDDSRIAKAASSFGAKVVMTRADHVSGTDRVFEAVSGLAPAPDWVLNVQGDEPGVGPEEVALVLGLLEDRPEADLATLAVRAGHEAGPDPSRVKVVLDDAGLALYFSRAPIPHLRDGDLREYLVHVGMYGFRREALARFVNLPPSPLERAERLEQLRALQAGMRIAVGLCDRAPVSVDTPEDFERFVRALPE